MHQSSSKLAYGTLKSPQQNLQQEEYGIIEDDDTTTIRDGGFGSTTK